VYAKILVTSILFSIALLPKATPAAHALGCVNADISNQIKVTGSKTAPGAQQNSVHQEIDPSCVGSVNVHKSTQTYVGAEGADQIRHSNQYIGGSGNNSRIPSNVMNAGNLNIQVGTAKTIYTPALDPKFLPKK
jgi:hypothetical protein